MPKFRIFRPAPLIKLLVSLLPVAFAVSGGNTAAAQGIGGVWAHEQTTGFIFKFTGDIAFPAVPGGALRADYTTGSSVAAGPG